MKLFVVFALFVASVTAGFIEVEPYHRDAVMPVVSEEINGRIVGGQKATPGQFPYQVGLTLVLGVLQQAWCGGSLISNNYVLTAAHCTEGVQSVNVYLGATLRNQPEKTITVYPADITIHKDWNSKTLKNDISLIKISSVSYTSNIQSVALAPANSGDFVGAVAVASGWGRTSDTSNSVATDLNYVDLTVITNAVCASTYGSLIVTSGNICTATTGGHSTCNGDSGGPLVTKNQQIGLTSFGSSSGCQKNYPAAFTRVSYYRQWIKDNSGV